MRCVFQDSAGVYTFGTSPRPSGADTRIAPYDAKRVLYASRIHPSRMQGFRRLLAESWPGGAVSRLGDGDVLEEMAAQVDARRLHAFHEPMRHRMYEHPEAEEIDEALGPLPVAEVVQEEAPLAGAAQAAVLIAAAQSGVPFCEECAKAAHDAEVAEAAAKATPPREETPFQNTDVAAQAAAMRDASADGAPFCEECERARLAAGASAAGGP